MSGIECINLLAFIQFIIAFDFGLYYLDNKHVLTEIYRKYQKDLKLSVREVLSRANDIITESLIKGKNVFEYNKNCNGAKDYMALAQEVLKLK